MREKKKRETDAKKEQYNAAIAALSLESSAVSMLLLSLLVSTRALWPNISSLGAHLSGRAKRALYFLRRRKLKLQTL